MPARAMPGGFATPAANPAVTTSPAVATPQAPGTIGGALPWNGGGGSMDYATAYNSALGMNQANYNNILAGYQQTAAQQRGAQDAIQGGYNNLYNTVLSGIQGVDASQRQAIGDSYAQQRGATSQQLIDRGLGNTTVQQSVDRGLSLDEQKANIALSNQFAQLQAGYQSNLGMAGLNQQNTANMQNTALASQQLGWMNSVNAQYPDAQMYAQLAQQYGAAGQNRDMQNRLGTFGGNPPGGFVSSGSGGGDVGGMPSQIRWGGTGGGGAGGGGTGNWGPADRAPQLGGGLWDAGGGNAVSMIGDYMNADPNNDNYGFGGYSNWGNDQQPAVDPWSDGYDYLNSQGMYPDDPANNWYR